MEYKGDKGCDYKSHPPTLDHSKSVKDFEDMGIPVCKPYEALLMNQFLENSYFTVRTFDLTTLDGRWTHTNADGSECPCYGFLITHPEMGRMLYITDTELIKWRFKGINHILQIIGIVRCYELTSRVNARIPPVYTIRLTIVLNTY